MYEKLNNIGILYKIYIDIKETNQVKKTKYDDESLRFEKSLLRKKRKIF